MKRILYRIATCGLLFFISSCKQDVQEPIIKDGSAPGLVSNVSIINLNGAAEISYTVPSDQDLLYIKAVYRSRKGEVRETKVSKYNRNLTVLGFGDTNPYEIELYAVDKSENSSAAVKVIANPLEPAMNLVRNGLKVRPDFGGINVEFENDKADNLAIVVLSNDALGNFVPINTFYTNIKKGIFPTRELKAEDTRFGIFVRDRWGNLSDTLYVQVTPYYEARLDRTKMRPLVLPTDAVLGYGGNLVALFDGDVGDGRFYHSGDAAKMPQWFSFDLGVTARLSRLTYYMRQSVYFNLHNPRDVEIWGSNNPPADGSYDGWVLLSTHKQEKPSGLPVGQLSQADKDAAIAGESIPIPADAPKVRYIRFKTLRNWTDGTFVNFNELTAWGDTR
ncbi:DUF5000 domain-containing lipoprotein [Pedobacter gandavensis]|uniref:DUF5000 domain-containing lipoprotein n=1 Tax=Pedobacter gandavensis TaxID=2679963 RepID=UPI00292F62C3|nr:DUF5000 domain-containing lipoprotein [Pedobacter gandavensis]